MKRIVRLTESELKRIINKSMKKALQNKAIINEHVDREREIALAQKTLCKFPLSDVGLRLEGTKFYRQFLRARDAIEELNNSLINHIRRKR